MPAELSIARKVDKYGVKAVYGRDVLTHAEIMGMSIADVVVRIYEQRAASNEWAKWMIDHPKEAAFLEAVEKIWQTQSR